MTGEDGSTSASAHSRPAREPSPKSVRTVGLGANSGPARGQRYSAGAAPVRPRDARDPRDVQQARALHQREEELAKLSADDQIRARILNATYQCLMESGYSTRLHAAIAERSGYSRPTVYKYLGDQQAIIGALVHRELTRYFSIARSVLTNPGTPRDRFVNGVTFSVHYGRQHPLLQKGLRENPEVVLPWFTTNSASLIAACMKELGPDLQALIDEGQIPSQINPQAIVEWMFRLAASLVISPTELPLDTPDDIRAYLNVLLNIGLAGFHPGGAKR